MNIVEVIRRSVFDWKVDAAPRVNAEPVAPPRVVHPEERLLRLVNARSFEEIERDADLIVGDGGYAGAMVAVRGASGAVVDYKKHSYGSAVEARVDFLIDAVDDAEAQREARQLQPLARRHALRSELRALDAMPFTERAPERQEQPVPAVRPRTVMVEGDYDAGLRSLQQQRRAAEQDHVDFLRRQFATRESLKVPSAPHAFDAVAERVRISAALQAWDDANSSLAQEIRAHGG